MQYGTFNYTDDNTDAYKSISLFACIIFYKQLYTIDNYRTLNKIYNIVSIL